MADRFRIVSFVAAGGVGQVYEASDLLLDERVALKTLRPEIAADDESLGRFRREILLSRRITHPNVCRIFEIFRHGDAARETTFVNMEFLEGETLARRIRRLRRLATDEALPILRQVVAGLGAAHRLNIVHSDLKSSNIMLVPDPEGLRAVVTDFGLARLSGFEPPADDGSPDSEGQGFGSSSTASSFQGTPAYAAPEQIVGEPVTPAADLYALGVVMYEMVTGKLPFVASSPMLAAVRRLSEPPPSPRRHVADLDPRWEAVILKCLEPEPSDRFASSRDVLTALEGQRSAVTLTRIMPRRVVAVLGFKNLSERAEATWLSTALAEMLTMELAVGEKLRMIPGENVARMRLDLTLDSTSLAGDTLAMIRRRLGTDLVVLGSFLASGDGRLRLHLVLQETASGEAVATLAETGHEKDLLDLVGRVGRQLRVKLGIGKNMVTERDSACLPAGEAARLYAEGLDKLRRFDPQHARVELEQAVELDPEAPLLRAALAEAWTALGYDARAEAEARRAMELAAGLPREERLLVEGRYHEAAKEWPRAVELYSALYEFFPDNLEYGLRLATAQLAAGRGMRALETLDGLRGLRAPASDDPRIDLREARAAEVTSDFKRALAAAEQAAKKGRELGSPLLLASARFRRGYVLYRTGDIDTAAAEVEAARRLFREVGHLSWEGRALNILGNIALARGDVYTADAIYGEALVTFMKIGNRSLMATVLNNIASLHFTQGHAERARQLHGEALEIAREIHDQRLESYLLNNAGVLRRWNADLRGAGKLFGESLRGIREIGDQLCVIMHSVNLGEVFHQEGRLDEAAEIYTEAIHLAREIGNLGGLAYALVGWGDLCLSRGDFDGARESYEESRELETTIGEKDGVATGSLALANLASEERRFKAAQEAAQEAVAIYAEVGRKDGEARAWAVLAGALAGRGEPPESVHQAIDAARRLAAGPYLSIRMEIELKAASIETRDDAAATLERLEELLGEAQTRGMTKLELETNLAMAEAELAAGRARTARNRFETLAKRARELGFALLADKAAPDRDKRL